MNSCRQSFQVVCGPEVGILGIEVLRPVPMITLGCVCINGRDPDLSGVPVNTIPSKVEGSLLETNRIEPHSLDIV